MTNFQFNALNDDAKAYAICRGALIGARYQGEFNILLYQIDSFYVEVFYDKPNDKISLFRSFTSTDQLAPYLEEINIDHLFND